MSRRRKRSENKKMAIITLLLLIFFVFVILLFSDDYNIFNWSDIRHLFGVSDGMVSGNYENYPISVHVLDVGKADAIYIKSHENNILIDSGDVDTREEVVQYLEDNNVKNFDLIIATHPHKDHIAGMPNVINSFLVKRFMMPDIPENILPNSKTYTSMIKSLENSDIFFENPVVGDKFDVGNLNVDILGPVKKYEDLNNNSIVAKLKYKDVSFLFTGDAEKESEKDLVESNANLKSTVLKVGHHGSKSSSTREFLNAVSPEYAVISVGPDSNNLPKDSTLKRLKENNIKTYRTDKNGTVVFVSEGEKVEVFTEK